MTQQDFTKPVYLDTYKFDADEKVAAARHKLAMFLTGFIMLTPHRIAVLCAPHLVKRFHLPPATVPLFIYKIHNPMELASFLGTVIQVLLSAIFAGLSQIQGVQQQLANGFDEDNAHRSRYLKLKPPPNDTDTWAIGEKPDAVITNCRRVASIICGWFMFLTSIFTFIFFISGGDYGYLGQFYWSVIIMAFANGIYSSFSFGVNVNAAIYAVGLPLSGFFTFVFHNCCKYLSNKFNWEDYDYTFVKLLIISTMLIQFITASWWTMDQYFQLGTGTKNDSKDPGAVIPNNSSVGEMFGIPRKKINNNYTSSTNYDAKQAWSHWSPILMLSMSLGTVYAFYPAITPYQLMDVEDANNTDFYVQFISAIPTLVIGVLDEIDYGPGSGDGYNSNNSADQGIFQNTRYNWYDEPKWNCFWIAAVPYVLCLHIFITMIHFPDGFISTFFHSRPRLLQAICVSFNFWQEILEIVGFSAAGKQSNPKAVTSDAAGNNAAEQIAYNGHVGMVNNFLFLFTMAITMFVGDGKDLIRVSHKYIVHVYHKLKRDKPHVVIFLGPFVSVNQVAVEGQNLSNLGDLTFLYRKFLSDLSNVVQFGPMKYTKFIIVPHCYDVLLSYPLPQPPLNCQSSPLYNKTYPDNIIFLSNPGFIKINELLICITSCDPLSGIAKNMVCRPNDLMERLICQQLLYQRSLFPGYPSSRLPSEYAVDHSMLRQLEFSNEMVPDVILFTSSLHSEPFITLTNSRAFISCHNNSLSVKNTLIQSVTEIYITPQSSESQVDGPIQTNDVDKRVTLSLCILKE